MTGKRIVLLGWKFGEGLGHVTRLTPLANVLAERGWARYFVVKNLHSLAQVFRATSYADILAATGFGAPETLLPVVQAWDTLIELLRPDLIIADFSPTLCLAAFDRIPVLTVGDGFVQPPANTKIYPRLRPGKSGLPGKGILLAVVAEIQRQRNGRIPPSLPKLTGGDCQVDGSKKPRQFRTSLILWDWMNRG